MALYFDGTAAYWFSAAVAGFNKLHKMLVHMEKKCEEDGRPSFVVHLQNMADIKCSHDQSTVERSSTLIFYPSMKALRDSAVENTIFQSTSRYAWRYHLALPSHYSSGTHTNGGGIID